MSFRFTLQRSWNSGHDPRYQMYRVQYTDRQNSFFAHPIGFVRYPRNRTQAREMGVPWRWAYSRTSDESANWHQAAWSSRTAAAEELANETVGTAFPIRTASSRPRRGTGRAFGIEMELTGPNVAQIITALRDAGIRMHPSNLEGPNGMRSMGYNHTNTNAHVWSLKHDGSVNGQGLELVSPKLRGQAGLDEVKQVCDALNGIGATVDRSCGLHVHHDFRGLDVDSIKRQAFAFLDRESVIMEMVAPSRRSGHTFCPNWRQLHRDQLHAVQQLSSLSYGIGPRGSLNMGAYAAHGSVELRSHAGTTNAKKIIAWIKFGQALFAAGEAQANISSSSIEDLLQDLIALPGSELTTEDAAWLLRFRTAGQTRSAVARRLEVLREELSLSRAVLEEMPA